MPCSMPSEPAASVAECRPDRTPSPPASTPTSLAPDPTSGLNVPMAFEPPPTHATTASGAPLPLPLPLPPPARARRRRTCERISLPMTL